MVNKRPVNENVSTDPLIVIGLNGQMFTRVAEKSKLYAFYYLSVYTVCMIELSKK